MPSKPAQLVFRRRHRLTRASEFDAVFAFKIRKSRGPITVFLRPNDLPNHRLGLSIGRRVGNAVVRGRLKRMIREVFRLHHDAFPIKDGTHLDLVVSARKHDGLDLEEYTGLILEAICEAHKVWARRAQG